MILRDKLKFWMALSNYVDMIVRGTSPLSLPDAIANSLSYVKAFGGTEQNGTPTPDAPVDIVSNNGALKTTRPSGLPAGYTALEYIESSGTQYIDTGVKVTQNNRVEVRYCYHTESSVGTSGRITGGRYTSGSPRNAFSMGTQNGEADPTTNMFSQFGTKGVAYAGPRVVIGDWFTAKSSTDGYYVNDTAYQAPIPTDDFETPYTVKLFAFEQSAPGGDPTIGCGVGRCANFKIYTNNVLTMNLVPAKNSEGTIGMYDIVNDVFYENAGTGDFVAGPNAVDPITIVTDGTVETIAIKNNIFTLVGATYDETIGGTGTSGSSPNNGYSDYLAVTSGDVYNFSDRGLSGVALYDQDKVFQSRPSVSVGDYTIPAGIAYIRVNFRQSVMNNVSITHTNYTATAEMLLKVGDYQDQQEIIDGTVTRKVGVKVLDGTGDWEEAGTSGANSHRFTLDLSAPSTTDVTALCTHIDRIIQNNATSQSNRPCIRFNTTGTSIIWYEQDNTTTLAQFKQWLADQHNAGTPVIVVYPLAEPTTESVAGQTLQVQAGDNTLEITQASLNNLELETKYQKEA